MPRIFTVEVGLTTTHDAPSKLSSRYLHFVFDVHVYIFLAFSCRTLFLGLLCLGWWCSFLDRSRRAYWFKRNWA